MDEELNDGQKKFRSVVIFTIIFLALFMGLCVGLGSAVIENLGTFAQGECINLLQVCSDSCTFNNVTSVMSPNSTFILNGQYAMTKNGLQFNFTSCEISQQIGCYTVNGIGDEGGTNGGWAYNYCVGGELNGFLILIYILFGIITIGLPVLLIMGVARLAVGETTIFDVLINWGFYLLVILTNYLAQNYVLTTFMKNLTEFYLTATVYTHGILPALFFIICFFIRILQKKKVLSVKEITGGLRRG